MKPHRTITIKIEKCSDCPYHGYVGGKGLPRCFYKSPAGRELDLELLPVWCPIWKEQQR